LGRTLATKAQKTYKKYYDTQQRSQPHDNSFPKQQTGKVPIPSNKEQTTMALPSLDPNENRESNRKTFERNPRPGYLSRFYIAGKPGEASVVFLDDDETLTQDQGRFLDAFGFPQGSTFKTKDTKGVESTIVSGFNWREHMVKVDGKFVNFPCTLYYKMRPYDRLLALNQFGLLRNADVVASLQDVSNPDSYWYMQNTLSHDVQALLIDAAPDFFKDSVRDFFAVPNGKNFDYGDGQSCRFCEADKVAKAANPAAQGTVSRKMARTIINLSTYTTKSGEKIVNPLQMFVTGGNADAAIRTERDKDKRGKPKKGLRFAKYALDRGAGDRSSSLGDSRTFEGFLTPEEVLVLNKDSVILLDQDKFNAMLLENGAYRYHLLHAWNAKGINSMDDCNALFEEVFPEKTLWLSNVADYRGNTLPRTPSYIRHVYGEEESVPVSHTTAKVAISDEDIPF
jgi:hypothetical protein